MSAIDRYNEQNDFISTLTGAKWSCEIDVKSIRLFEYADGREINIDSELRQKISHYLHNPEIVGQRSEYPAWRVANLFREIVLGRANADLVRLANEARSEADRILSLLDDNEQKTGGERHR